MPSFSLTLKTEKCIKRAIIPVAGFEEICLVIGPEEQEEYEEFFRPMEEEHIQTFSAEK